MIKLLKTGFLLNNRQSRYSTIRGFNRNHPFKIKKYSSHELADELVKEPIFCQDGFIVLNKPQGISFAENLSQDDNSFEVSFHSLRSILKNKFKCKDIFNAKVPEKYASGVAVFCTDEKLLNQVKRGFRSMRGCGLNSELYDCIVIGQPSYNYGKFEGGITLECSPNGKQKGIRLIKECAKSKIRKGIIKPVKIEHKSLAIGELASRIAISTNRTKWHAVRVYAATELVSPLLGDNIFGRLVRTALGNPILVDRFSPAAFQPKKLSKELLSKLNLISRDDIEIPLHLHLSKVTLFNFPSKGKHMEFNAKLPEYYQWTCSSLGLTDDKGDLLVENECNINLPIQ